MIRVMGAVAVLVVAAYAPASKAQQSNQNTYPSAEEAAQSLYQAVHAGDEEQLSQVLGGERDLLETGDKSQDDVERRQFVAKYQQMHRLVREPDGTILYVGAENWPFPIPLVSKNGAWFFDTIAGMQEVVFRRIGANETSAIEACHALARPDGRDVGVSAGNSVPFHGYYFRALPSREKHASFIAYPAEYRSSGVMTFVVDRSGVVYERDLGPRTPKAATTKIGYEPDSSWHAVQ